MIPDELRELTEEQRARIMSLVADVARAAQQLRASYAPLYHEEWREDWAAFREAGPPQVDVVVTSPGSTGERTTVVRGT